MYQASTRAQSARPTNGKGDSVMSKQEIIKQIRDVSGCTEEKAEVIFERAVANRDITTKLDWVYVVNHMIIAAIIVVGLWALWRRLL